MTKSSKSDIIIYVYHGSGAVLIPIGGATIIFTLALIVRLIQVESETSFTINIFDFYHDWYLQQPGFFYTLLLWIPTIALIKLRKWSRKRMLT